MSTKLTKLMKSIRDKKSISPSLLTSILNSKLSDPKKYEETLTSLVSMVSLMSHKQATRAYYLIFEFIALNEEVRQHIDDEFLRKLMNKFKNTTYIKNIICLKFSPYSWRAYLTQKEKIILRVRKLFESVVTEEQLLDMVENSSKMISKTCRQDTRYKVYGYKTEWHLYLIYYSVVEYYKKTQSLLPIIDIVKNTKLKCISRLPIFINDYYSIDDTKYNLTNYDKKVLQSLHSEFDYENKTNKLMEAFSVNVTNRKKGTYTLSQLYGPNSFIAYFKVDNTDLTMIEFGKMMVKLRTDLIKNSPLYIV